MWARILFYILPSFLDCFFSIRAIDHGAVETFNLFGHDKRAIIVRKIITVPIAIIADTQLHGKPRTILRISFASVNTGLAVNAIIQTR